MVEAAVSDQACIGFLWTILVFVLGVILGAWIW